MKFIIDKNVPPPTGKSGICSDLIETMKDMQPNESFIVLFNKTRPKKSIITAYQYAREKLKDRKFTSATQKEDSNLNGPGLRIWCLPNPPAKPATPTTPKPQA